MMNDDSTMNDEAIARALADPELCSIQPNVAIAEQILSHYANACRHGGFTDRTLSRLRSLIDRTEQHLLAYTEAVRTIDAASQALSEADAQDAKRIERLTALREASAASANEAVDGWGECIDALEELATLASNDPDNAADLKTANKASVTVKEAAARVDAMRSKVTSHDELRRLIAEMLATVTEEIERNVPRDQAEQIVTAIHAATRGGNAD